MKRKILISISGGRTSAYMAILCKKIFHDCDLIYVFANTSREKDETLDFLHNVDREFNLGIVWVEAVVNHGERKSTGHKVVDYYSAKRDGSVFEEVIKKYGIPNSKFLHCTRELKTNPIKSYAKASGFGIYGKDYETAIGYRYDEPKRVNRIKAIREKHIYPMFSGMIRKDEVLRFWSEQSFDLGLKEHEGNCKLCYKKSKRKLLTQIAEDPDTAKWIFEMEAKYSFQTSGRDGIKPPYYFFRDNDSIRDLVEESLIPFEYYNDGIFESHEMDKEEFGCATSCEPF